MNNNQDNNTFSYTYSAPKQEEIRKIRAKYLPKTEDKMEQLRRLDKKATEKGTVTALILGILGILFLGIGMSFAMVWGDTMFVWGIVIGLQGIADIALAYPVYQYITRREREKIAPEILRLTDELLK